MSATHTDDRSNEAARSSVTVTGRPWSQRVAGRQDLAYTCRRHFRSPIRPSARESAVASRTEIAGRRRRPDCGGDDVIDVLAYALVAAGLLLGVWSGIQAYRNRPTNDALMIAAIAVEAGLVVQSGIGIVTVELGPSHRTGHFPGLRGRNPAAIAARLLPRPHRADQLGVDHLGIHGHRGGCDDAATATDLAVRPCLNRSATPTATSTPAHPPIREPPPTGPRRILIALYLIFALAATSRGIVQLATTFHSAPLAYVLSLCSGIIYIAAAIGLDHRSALVARACLGCHRHRIRRRRSRSAPRR